MAGESPGKPEQKQSSGETAGSERDPRLAVFREAPAGPAKPGGRAGGSGESESGGSGAGESGGSGQGGTAGKGAADEAAGDAEGGANGEGRDERLREAVAAWVAAKDDDGDGDGDDGESGSGAGSGSGKGAAGAEGGAESETRAKAETAGAPVTKAPKGGSEGGSKGGSEGAAKDAAEGAPKGAAKEASKGAAKGAPKGAGKGAAAGGGESSGPKGGSGGSAAGSASKGSSAKGATPKGATPKGATPKGSAPKASAPKGEDASDGASKGAAESVDQPTAIFKAPDVADGREPVDSATRTFTVAKQKGSDGAGPAKSGKGGTPAAEADSAKADAGTKADAKADAGTKADAKGDAKSGESEAKPESEPEPGSKAAPKAEAAPKSDKADKESKADKADAPSDKAAPKPSADQPTTAIKAVRPPGAAESDGERTSQFVALKSTDPQPIKPPRPVGGKSDRADKSDKSDKAGKSADSAKPVKPGKAEAQGGAKTDDKPGAKPGTASGALPAAEPDVAPGTKWGAKAAGKTEAASGAKPEAKSGATEAPAAAAPAGATAQPGALPDSERTKQQPLPPLDLLAQLTNTPPPPETPLRTVARRFKIWTPLAILLAIIFVVVQQVRPLPDPTLALGEKTSYTFAGDRFQMPWPGEGQAAAKVVGAGDLGTYGDEKPVPTASVAKIMTAYLILKDHPLKKDEGGPKIKVDDAAVKDAESKNESRVMGLKEGQEYSEQLMLQMLMIPSGNNIARLLARWDTQSSTVDAFVKKMNDTAKDLGMKNTKYTDPSGLNKTTVSTAVDQLKLAEEVMKMPAFRQVVAMPNADKGLPERIYNNNNLMSEHRELSIKGIKTGSSTAAGGALVWAAYKGVDGKDQLILGATMDQHAKGLDPDGGTSLRLVQDRTKPMIEAIRNALTSATTVKKGQVVGYVDDGLGGQTPVVATKDLKAIGVPGQKIEFKVGPAAGKPVPHEAKAGTVVGELTVGTGSSAAKVPVALQKDLAEPTFGSKLTRIG
ncbi:D-alanyl-D-alanine carboxypeptidase [Streptomyces sp. NPDC059788]|uniref:D-alanyl-D-alanine carboxypeptidase n=1 Tax=Streptomyces sp. NPDC059788 TaxID=3346948 RepID=UPI00364B2D35